MKYEILSGGNKGKIIEKPQDPRTMQRLIDKGLIKELKEGHETKELKHERQTKDVQPERKNTTRKRAGNRKRN